MKIVECVPNYSEGRNKEVVDQIINAITARNVQLLDTQMDKDHNRSVVTFIGEPDEVIEAALLGMKKAVELIDLNIHKGEHPRIGACDVVPFVPISDCTMEECVELAKRFGKRVWDELKVPIYFYEAAASTPERKNLENIRKGQYEGLKEAIKEDPSRKPDIGELELHPTAGAVVVGARPYLIAYNIYLNTSDISIAKTIAKYIRASSGGFSFIKAMGFDVNGFAQVSINVTDFTKNALYRVFETVKMEARRYGVSILKSEIVGMVPLDALAEVAKYYLQLNDFDNNQILEKKLNNLSRQK